MGRIKLRYAEQLRDKVLRADADMNKADWLTGLATAVGVLGIELGFWWADAVAGLVIAVFAIREGIEAWKGDACATSAGMLLEGEEVEDDCCSARG